jgi:hypothetical protein
MNDLDRLYTYVRRCDFLKRLIDDQQNWRRPGSTNRPCESDAMDRLTALWAQDFACVQKLLAKIRRKAV